MKALSVAFRGKGPIILAKRALDLAGSYGVAASRMEGCLGQFLSVLDKAGCSATVPITAAVLGRHSGIIEKFRDRGLEFAIHGYSHIDYGRLDKPAQTAHIERSKQLFASAGIPARGYRAPYMRFNDDTLAALREWNFSYDSSQALSFEIPGEEWSAAYLHLLEFYQALSETDVPSLPSLEEGLVRIPYSLPDDEALINRLFLRTAERMTSVWMAMLKKSYELGEMLVLGLHPERISVCRESLTAVLEEAQRLRPGVWIARMEEIDTWWRARNRAEVRIEDIARGRYRFRVESCPQASILIRGVTADAPVAPWSGGYLQVKARSCIVEAPVRPIIGLAPDSAPVLGDFLKQQGYLVETAGPDLAYAFYLEQRAFDDQDRRRLINLIENSDRPLVRLGRWPNGTRSALSVTGDVDAWTLWDFGWRLFGG